MDFKKIFAKALPVLSQVAPGIAAAIGGPVPAIASAAISAIANTLGDPEAAPEQIAMKVAGATPDQLLALRQQDKDFQIRMTELGVDVFRLEFADTAHAREMGSKSMHRPQMALTLIFYIGFFLTTWWILTSVAPTIGEFQKTALIYLLGILSGEIPRMQQYWFGTTSGSQEKNKLLANMKPPGT